MTKTRQHGRLSMQTIHLSSSKKTAATLLIGLFGALLLSGCSSQVARLEATPQVRSDPNEQVAVQEQALASEPVVTAAASHDSKAQSTQLPVANSPWCRYLREDTAADTAIMRSPSLSGSMTDEGRASLNLGVSMSSFVKADLLERSAEVKCRRYLAEKGLQKLVFISPEGLSAAGFRAKSDAIFSARGEINAMRGEVNAALSNGDMDQARATALLVQADQLIADANSAKSNADRRLDAAAGRPAGAAGLTDELMRAEAELSDISSEIRTADAVDVSVSAGWNDDVNDNGFDATKEDFGGKVSFSMKLGAFAPSRTRHEEAARAARVDAINREEGGTLWQIAALRRAHENAIEGLVASRSQVDASLQRARGLVAQLRDADNPEFMPTLLGAKLQVIRLRAERAAVDSSISEIKSNLRRLGRG